MLGFDRITFDSNIMGGQACIRGMRIPVSLIVNLVPHGKSQEEIIEEYPDLETQDIKEALLYAAWLTRDEVHFHRPELEPVASHSLPTWGSPK